MVSSQPLWRAWSNATAKEAQALCTWPFPQSQLAGIGGGATYARCTAASRWTSDSQRKEAVRGSRKVAVVVSGKAGSGSVVLELLGGRSVTVALLSSKLSRTALKNTYLLSGMAVLWLGREARCSVVSLTSARFCSR